MTIDVSRTVGPALAAMPGLRTGLRVLVVDDSAAQRRLLSKVLVQAGYEVEALADAEAALSSLAADQPAIIVCDWMMPGMSGPDFCAAVRRMGLDRYVYIIIITSLTDKTATTHALDIGADDFLTKPVSAPELRARVQAGQRVVEMQAQVLEKNRQLSDAFDKISDLYGAIERDLAQARQLQRALLPEPGLVADWGRAAFVLRSAGKVGGDLVGHFPAGDGRVGFFSLDVSGHGIASALLTARLAGMFSSSAPDQNVAMAHRPEGGVAARAPDKIASEINRQLLSEIETELYLTLCLAVLDTRTGTVDLVQAGHPHPLIRRHDGRVDVAGHGGMPVGLLPDAPYDTVTITLGPGDSLLLQSDGLTECPDPANAMLGEEGLARILSALPFGAPDAALAALVGKLSDHAGTGDFPDDVSALLIEYDGPCCLTAD
ncbi:SpoIIE family protein phosphatase [Rhodobacterales bacterium HKCCE3408]|nr:SpoIIE family protein phosphatase [Rhodobacterales bacterium HKCCE3408]